MDEINLAKLEPLESLTDEAAKKLGITRENADNKKKEKPKKKGLLS